MDIIRRFGFIGAACFFMACSHQNAQKPADEPIQAFCIDFNWSGKGYAGLSLPEDYSQADPKEHFEWYKAHGVNTIQSFCVSHNGYAWYDSDIVPKVPGLRSNFLKDLVDMGHREGMKVMGYFSPDTNVRWMKEHPDEVYDNQTMFHIVYTSEYLTYLGNVIYEAVSKTGIDGFMIDALFTAPRDSAEAMKWMPCERQIYDLKIIQDAIGSHTQLIQCISGWASHDAKSLLDQNDEIKRGWYGFAWPDSATTLPYTLESAQGDPRFRQNAMNIEEMTKFYKGNK